MTSCGFGEKWGSLSLEGRPRKSRSGAQGAALLRRDQRRVLGCEGWRHLAGKDRRPLSSWKSPWVLWRTVGGRAVHGAGVCSSQDGALGRTPGLFNIRRPEEGLGFQEILEGAQPGRAALTFVES